MYLYILLFVMVGRKVYRMPGINRHLIHGGHY